MELSWIQSMALGLVSGLTEILPVSSQAHQTILLNFFGGEVATPMTRLVIHAATLLTVLFSIWGQIARIRRQLQLVRMPRRRRNRPVEMTALMDAKIIRTAIFPILLMLLLYSVSRRISSMLLLALVSLVNAAVLYLPSLFPTADKDSRLITPLEGLFMGLGTGAAVIPGISSIGVSYSVGVLHGVDRKYMVHLSLMMHLIFTAGLIFYDLLDLVIAGGVAFSVSALIGWVAAALAAVVGTRIGLNALERAARKKGLTDFAFYSFGVALFAFIFYLVV